MATGYNHKPIKPGATVMTPAGQGKVVSVLGESVLVQPASGKPIQWESKYIITKSEPEPRRADASLPVVGRDPGWRSSLGHEIPASDSWHGVNKRPAPKGGPASARATGNMQTGPRGGKYIIGKNGKKYYPVKGGK